MDDVKLVQKMLDMGFLNPVVTCPGCYGNVHLAPGPRYKCSKCKRGISVLTGSAFSDLHVHVRYLFGVTHQFSYNVPVTSVSASVPVGYNTAVKVSPPRLFKLQGVRSTCLPPLGQVI